MDGVPAQGVAYTVLQCEYQLERSPRRTTRVGAEAHELDERGAMVTLCQGQHHRQPARGQVLAVHGRGVVTPAHVYLRSNWGQ